MKYYTTLQRLREANTYTRGYNLIAAHVGHDYTGDIDLLTILEVNGMDDCIWAMRATDGGKELTTAFAIYCTERIYKDPAWTAWAARWMSGEDRTAGAADAAGAAAWSAAAADAAAVAARSAAAADAAVAAAWSAAWSAAAADAAAVAVAVAARSAVVVAVAAVAVAAADAAADAARSAAAWSAAGTTANTWAVAVDAERSAQVSILKELLK